MLLEPATNSSSLSCDTTRLCREDSPLWKSDLLTSADFREGHDARALLYLTLTSTAGIIMQYASAAAICGRMGNMTACNLLPADFPVQCAIGSLDH